MPSLICFASLSKLLLTASCIKSAIADLGVVNIDNLLHTKDQPVYTAFNDGNSDNASENPPWSHEPHCIPSTSLSSVGKKYCVYTSNLTGPTGISLIMPPKIARQAASLLDDNPLDSFLTPVQARGVHSGNPPYKMKKVEGKGMGVVATRRIRKWETVMVDQASVVVDLSIVKGVSREEGRRLLALAVRRLRRPGEVWGLSGKHDAEGRGEDGEGNEVVDNGKEERQELRRRSGYETKSGDGEEMEGKLEDDIMLTNGFGSEIAGTKCRALYPLISRINHECNPNAFVLFSRAGISMAVKAYRDIEEGEELSISYITLGQPFQHRHRALSRWGFACHCSLCSLPNPQKAASDTRRSLIARSTKKITELWESAQPMEAISLAEESIEMIQDEGLEHLLADEYALLAKLWLMVGKAREQTMKKGRGGKEKGKGRQVGIIEREEADRYARMSWELLGEMGFMGYDWKETMEFKLEAFLAMVGEGMREVVTAPKL
ncbi:SET domain-containing protein [Massarina eburnea CBS 473.64]|uniref:SET domain-containing protein n=1 Tax=Massarina eburnea CBS 473.64 TaxID=1395130 RepID=A0A6A6SE90_9PLEO|nr:SET domain-containing protein [Massarina eburnea CBS 473.64]